MKCEDGFPPTSMGSSLGAFSFKVNDFVTDYNVSTLVTSQGGDVVCERAMYGDARTWAHDSIGYAP